MRWVLALMALPAVGCGAMGDDAGSRLFDPEPEGEGVAHDALHPGADPVGKGDSPKTYQIPEDLPPLSRPEIIVSLDGLTVHLFDRAEGVSRVYPTGVGKLGSSGRSYTPRGFFRTHDDPDEYWYNIARRYVPEYFGGFPFLRIDAENSRGQHTYGFHGPITYSCPDGDGCSLLERQWFLMRDYVSHGCMRMRPADIVEMFWMLRGHGAVPIAIIGGLEHDAEGDVVDIDRDVMLWAEGETIAYADCGERLDPYTIDGRWTSRSCN